MTLWRSTHQVIAATLCWSVLSSGCTQPVRPAADTSDVLIISGDGTELMAVRAQSGMVEARPGPVPPWPAAQSPDRESLVYSGSTGQFAERELATLDTRTLAISTRWRLQDLESTSQVSGVSLPNLTSVAFTPDQSRLLVSPATKAGVEGIAIVNRSAGRVVGFLDSMRVADRGMVPLPPRAGLPQGAIAVAVSRDTPSGTVERWLLILDPTSFQHLDSLRFGTAAQHSIDPISGLTPLSSGLMLYVKRGSWLLRVGLASMTTIDSLSVSTRGLAFLAPGDTSLFIADPGDDRDIPGSGVIVAATPDLRSSRVIDVRHSAISGAGPSVRAVTVSADGRTIIALIGNARVGPLFPSQQLKLLLLDAGTLTLRKSHDLGVWAGGFMVLKPGGQ